MNTIRRQSLLRTVSLAGLVGWLPAYAPIVLAADDPVQVQYADPVNFDEFHGSEHRLKQAQSDWLPDLTAYIEAEAAKRLPAGQTLSVTITDLRRAGTEEPFLVPGQPPVRVVRDKDTPSVDLTYRISDAWGTTLKSGEAQLRDLGFLRGINATRSDALAFEKNLIDDWLRDLLPQS